MSATSSTTSSAVEKSYNALQNAYVAAIKVLPLLQLKGPTGSPQEQRKAIDDWAFTYLTCEGAPPELVQDCVRRLQSITTGSAAGSAGDNRSSLFARSQLTISSVGQQSDRYGVQNSSSDGDSSSSGDDCAATSDQSPASISPYLDVDHCSIARMMVDENQQWVTLHKTRTDLFEDHFGKGVSGYAGALSSPEAVLTAFDDVFSEEAIQWEAWQCWAAILRDVKTEAAVQQQSRHNRESSDSRNWDDHGGRTQPPLDGLFDYLETPETPWLLEDPNSSVLIATDMYMVNRAHAQNMPTQQRPELVAGNSASGEGEHDAEDTIKRSGKLGSDTHDMKAVHAFLTRQDANKPPLRSLLELTLMNHISDRKSAC